MKDLIETVVGAAIVSTLGVVGMYAFITPDPMSVENSRRAAEQAQLDKLDRVHACVSRFLQAYDNPTPAQVDAAYRDCE